VHDFPFFKKVELRVYRRTMAARQHDPPRIADIVAPPWQHCAAGAGPRSWRGNSLERVLRALLTLAVSEAHRAHQPQRGGAEDWLIFSV
jgi:hypothetical protein